MEGAGFVDISVRAHEGDGIRFGMLCSGIRLRTPLLSSTDCKIGQASRRNTREGTYMYGKKLLYNVDARPMIPHITISRLVDNAIFLVANSALMCEPEKCEPLDKSPVFPFASTTSAPGGV